VLVLRNVLITTGLGLWNILVSTSARADGARSDSDNSLGRDYVSRLSSGGAIAAGRFREFGSRERAMTVSARLCSLGSVLGVVS